MNINKKVIYGFGLLFFVLIGAAFYGGLIFEKNFIDNNKKILLADACKNSNNLSGATRDLENSATLTKAMGNLQIYSSLDGQFFLYFSPFEDENNKCFFGIKDRESNLITSDIINCNHCGTGEETVYECRSDFLGWKNNNQFLMQDGEGKIKIFGFMQNGFDAEGKLYEYDQNIYAFRDVNNSLEYWLFWKKSTSDKDGSHYSLFDRSGKIIIPDIFLEPNSRGVLYDVANDGFLFMDRIYSENEDKTKQMMSVKLDFLSLKSLSLRNILTTEPVVVEGRGCLGEELLSKKGEIILTPGCLAVGEKYLSKDGNIHIKL